VNFTLRGCMDKSVDGKSEAVAASFGLKV